jgi:hypothetical protein
VVIEGISSLTVDEHFEIAALAAGECCQGMRRLSRESGGESFLRD